MQFQKKRISVAGRSTVINVKTLKVFGEVDVTLIDFDSSITIPVTRPKKIEDLVVLILSQALDVHGVATDGEYEFNFVAHTHEDRLVSVNAQEERHSVLVELIHAPVQPDISPRKQLVLIIVDLKYPRLIHMRRVLRRTRVRWHMLMDQKRLRAKR